MVDNLLICSVCDHICIQSISFGVGYYKMYELLCSGDTFSTEMIIISLQDFSDIFIRNSFGSGSWLKRCNPFIKVCSQTSSYVCTYVSWDRGQTQHYHYSASLVSYSTAIPTGPPAPHARLAAAGLLNHLHHFVLHFVSMHPETQRVQTDLDRESSCAHSLKVTILWKTPFLWSLHI